MSHRSIMMSVCALVVLHSGTAAAQSPMPADQRVGPSAQSSNAPLRFDHTQVGMARRGIAPSPESNAIATREALASGRLASRRSRGPGTVLMLLGAAGVVTGLVIDENAFTIVGAAVGLFGLYQYLRAT